MKLGYIIANQYAEYLQEFHLGADFDSLAWTMSPGRALVFKSRSKCHRVMKRMADPKYQLWEMSLTETKDQFIVGCSCEVLPPWFDDQASFEFHPFWIQSYEAFKANFKV